MRRDAASAKRISKTLFLGGPGVRTFDRPPSRAVAGPPEDSYISHAHVERAVSVVAGDRSVTSLFEVDLELLEAKQRSILSDLARGDGETLANDFSGSSELIDLGFSGTDKGP